MGDPGQDGRTAGRGTGEVNHLATVVVKRDYQVSVAINEETLPDLERGKHESWKDHLVATGTTQVTALAQPICGAVAAQKTGRLALPGHFQTGQDPAKLCRI
jgi:hypothetical protein